MNPTKVISIFDKELEDLQHARYVVENLKPKTSYHIKIVYDTGRWDNPNVTDIRVIARVKSYNKESIRLLVLAASDMDLVNRDLSVTQDKLMRKFLVDNMKDTSKKYWEYSQEEKMELIKNIDIPTLETTLGYGCFLDWSEFKAVDAPPPLVVGYDYVSPKFKKDFFNA